MQRGDKCYAVFGIDSGDGGEWLVEVFHDPADAEHARVTHMKNRPARMTETWVTYEVRELVLQ